MASLWMNPERAHVRPVMSDSVNTSGGELKEKKHLKYKSLKIYSVALRSFHLLPFVLLQFDADLHTVLILLADLSKRIINTTFQYSSLADAFVQSDLQ